MFGNKLINIMQQVGKQKSNETTDLLFGEVTSDDPLKIKIDDRFEVDETFLILSGFVKETIIKIPFRDENQHNHAMDEMLVDYQAVGNLGAPIIFAPLGVDLTVTNPDDPDGPEIPNPILPTPNVLPLKHLHAIHNALPEILLWRGLEVGDKVRVLRIDNGQKFYVLERVEGID